MFLWITGIIISLVIAAIVYSLNEQINKTNWHPLLKFLLKTIVWIGGIIATIFTAFLVAMLSGSSDKE